MKKGGVGVWGEVPMPPNSQVSDEDVKKLVKWVLSPQVTRSDAGTPKEAASGRPFCF